MKRMRRVNVDGVIHTMHAVAPGRQERSYGRIVNMASNAAISTALCGNQSDVLILTSPSRQARSVGMSSLRRAGSPSVERPGSGHEYQFENRILLPFSGVSIAYLDFRDLNPATDPQVGEHVAC
jgi:hypothetical protein